MISPSATVSQEQTLGDETPLLTTAGTFNAGEPFIGK